MLRNLGVDDPHDGFVGGNAGTDEDRQHDSKARIASARSERSANATASGIAVSASPTLWIRSARRATLPVRTKITP